jgi:hypothetical protein
MKKIAFYCCIAFALSVLLFIMSCGGSSTSDSSSVPTTTITGSVFAAPVGGATVVVLNSSGTTTVAGPVSTADDGTYSINIPTSALANDLIISSNSGTFTDEATATATTAGTLAAYVTGGALSTGATVNIDPSSTIIHAIVTGSSKTYGEANAIFNAAFGYTPDTSVAPKNGPTSGQDTAQRLAGLRAAVFSQLTKDLGFGPDRQFDLLAALSQDLADDGKLNGSAGSVNGTNIPEDIQNKFECALVSFLSNTTANLTGLTADQIGSLPFAKVALTNTYKVEYLPGMMAASQGKTAFKIRVTNRSNGSPATGLTVSLMPMMHMAAMSHSTPVDVVTESATAGTYDCTVYYLMASGPGMGYWELKVMISGMMGDTATFYPNVGMAMGANTVRTTLKGQNDIISSMTGTEKRSYYLFRDGLSGSTGNHTFNLFITAKESMMSYPAVSVGATLHDDQSNAWTVNPMTVEASTDRSTWTAGTDNSGGHWSISGLSGLTDGQAGTVYVRIFVNTEQKTTDGNAPSGANAYATFAVTPGM